MADVEKKVDGVEAIGDDQLDAVAGGKNFERCDYGQCYEASFPERCCKNCPDFKKEKFDKNETAKKYKFYCGVFKRTEWKRTDPWNFF